MTLAQSNSLPLVDKISVWQEARWPILILLSDVHLLQDGWHAPMGTLTKHRSTLAAHTYSHYKCGCCFVVVVVLLLLLFFFFSLLLLLLSLCLSLLVPYILRVKMYRFEERKNDNWHDDRVKKQEGSEGLHTSIKRHIFFFSPSCFTCSCILPYGPCCRRTSCRHKRQTLRYQLTGKAASNQSC